MLRVFKLFRFIEEAQMLCRALPASACQIGVLLFFVVMAQAGAGLSKGCV